MSFITSFLGGGNTSGASPGVAHNGPQPAPIPVVNPPAAAPAPAPAVAAPVTAVSQLDNFNSLWQTPTTADGKPAPIPADPLRQPLFTLDPNKVAESANRLDFTASISPELIAKATSGDPAAFAQALNEGIRQAVVGLTVNQGNLINQALLENNSRVTSQLPKHIKEVQLLQTGADDPVLSHPAVQPLVSSLKKMAFAKDPNASPAEIDKQVSGYLRGLGSALSETDPAAVQQRQQQAKGEPDWSSFLA